ncbi:MAG: hypothetical protein DMF91_28035 [Acidobacteria bacterium]|nr:MAG: hypothetical protein DMF91_28035 [Acidobacteriota bacterium]
MRRGATLAATLALATSVNVTAGHARSTTQTPARSPVRPNIIWISNEDMSPRLGAYGDSIARTPALDRFARESIRYTSAFTTAPVCAPSRAAIITGMYQTAIGAHHMRTTEDRVPELPGPYLACARPVITRRTVPRPIISSASRSLCGTISGATRTGATARTRTSRSLPSSISK